MSAGVGASGDVAEHEQEQEQEQDADRRPGIWIRVTPEGYACVTCSETFETVAAAGEHTREEHDPFLPGDDYTDRRYRDREWLRRTLVEQGSTAIRTANRLDVTPDTIQRWADRFGFEYDRVHACWRDPANNADGADGEREQDDGHE